MRKLSSILFSLGLIISLSAGILHFFVPYLTGWYSYIPEAPREIYASIDYVNFFFSLLLSGLSLILLYFKKKIFEGSKDIFIFYVLLVFTWFCRVLITIVIPWPTALQTWLMVGFISEFIITLIPAIYLLRYKKIHELY
jgi:magnesium-transporting ATPase (P-type)